MTTDTELRLVSIDNGHACFALFGRMDFSNAGQMLYAGQKAFAGHAEVIITIEGADCANTAGLALLMEWHLWCQSSNIKMSIEKPGARLAKLVDTYDVAQILCLPP